MFFNISETDKKSLFANVSNGNMKLLLGAGFSVGAKDASGNDILLGDKLGADLLQFADLNISNTRTLGQIYDAACSKVDQFQVNEFLKNKYRNCRSSWHNIVSTFAWERIYTLNIDDVLEDAYRKCRDPLQRYKPVNYKDKYGSHSTDIDEVQLIHLHGSVHRHNHGFIFGAREYAVASRDKLTWHLIFADDFSEGNFIIVGSQLIEPDIEHYLAYRSELNKNKKCHHANSFYVSPEIDDVLKNIMEKNGITCIKATAEDFFKELNGKVPNRKKPSEIRLAQTPKIASYTSAISTTAYIKFCHQFKQIQKHDQFTEPDALLHDFYFGDAPDWWDIQTGNDAVFTICKSLESSILSSTSKLHILLGNAGCGKTTTIMRVARTFANIGWQVYFLQDESSIDVDAAYKVLKTTENAKVLVLVDNAAEFVDQIDALMTRFNNISGLKIFFVIAERQNRAMRITDSIRTANFQTYEMDWMNETDINLIIDKLTEKDKLRTLRGKSHGEQAAFFKKTSDKQLLVAMRELSGGGRFDKIISDEFSTIDDKIAQKIYVTTALCHSQQLSVSAKIVHRTLETEIGIEELLEKIESGSLKHIVLNKGNRLLTRHSLIAQQILKAGDLQSIVTSSVKASLLTNLMIALSFYVNQDELARGTPESKLVRSFMDYNHVHNVLHNDVRALDDFFKSIRDYYDWNSKYWAQRGLFESERKHYADAIDFVRHAAELDNHWTIRNSKGIVMLRASASEWLDDFNKAKEHFNNGIQILGEVLTERGLQEPKGCEAILNYVYYFAKRWKQDLDELYQLFEKYFAIAERQTTLDKKYIERVKLRRTDMMKIKLNIATEL